MVKKKSPPPEPNIIDLPADEFPMVETESEENVSAVSVSGNNAFIRKVIDQNFIEYASYVIKERAIPDIDDGLKPVQRRILWSLFRMDDGKFHKVANVIGHTMQFHPHGDASIGDALVVVANKELYIEKQGNFGNILTGDPSSAPRYIECRLTPLGREVLFNSDITEFIDSYDGRNLEPVRLPVKIPSLLILGAEGIAVGMATSIPPHNFNEVLKAQIAILKNESFVLYPDFPQGGLMDVSEYERGAGKLKLRARIEKDGRRLVIRDVTPGTTTETLLASIEKAAEKNKIKIQKVEDYTAEKVEVEIIPARGYDPEKALNALYAYTDCQVSFSANLLVIQNNHPVSYTVDKILLRNTEKLLEYLGRELAIELQKLAAKLHERTLERIFIEERIYKRIENCKARDAVYQAVRDGFEPFHEQLCAEITEADIDRLLAIPIRRISLFDMKKNLDEIEVINGQIKECLAHLKRLNAYAIDYLRNLIKQYGAAYPRKTEITTFEKINLKAAALSNIRVGWDRKGCYIGSNVKSDESVVCTEYDRLLCIDRGGNYRVIRIPEKLFVDKLYDFRKYDSEAGFCMVYTDKKSGKAFWKRFQIDKAMTDKAYQLCPAGCRIDLLTPRMNATFEVTFEGRTDPVRLNLWEAPERSARSRGLLVDSHLFAGIKFVELVDGIEVTFGNPIEDGGTEEEEADVPFALEEEDDDRADFGDQWKIPKKEMETIRNLIQKAHETAEHYEKAIPPLPDLPSPSEPESEPSEAIFSPPEPESPPPAPSPSKAEPVSLSAAEMPSGKRRKHIVDSPSPADSENESGETTWGMKQMDFGF